MVGRTMVRPFNLHLAVRNLKTNSGGSGGTLFYSFVRLLRLVDGRLRAHRPNASFSAILADGRARFKPSSRGVWGAAAPQENVRTQLTEPPKTKRLVDGRACAHGPNAIDERTKNRKVLV